MSFNASPILTAAQSPGDTTPSTPYKGTSDSSSDSYLDGISRSASYTQFPSTTPSDAQQERNDIKRTFSENLIANPKANNFRHASIKKKSNTSDGSGEHRDRSKLTRKLSTASKHEAKITISKFMLGGDENEVGLEYQPKSSVKTVKKSKIDGEVKPKSFSKSLSKLTRQSWIAPSRSPPPENRASQPNHRLPTAASSREALPSTVTDSDSDKNGSDSTNGHSVSQPEKDSVQRNNSRRPLSSILSMTSLDGTTPKVPPLPKSLSTERLPTSNGHTTSEKPPDLPKSRSFERLQSKGTESPRRRDDLWSAFRALDGDFQKFYSRPSNSKCAVVRSTLLPFLRSHSKPLPDFSLRPEDLDRRVNVLNKWWTGLLEMLNGRNGESVSGSDRPTVLEAITAIMTRPEWSVSPSFSPHRYSRLSSKSRSTTSLRSTTSDFLAESVAHNVRNTFVQNLLAQMAYVVNKMSARSVPASVVAFCGKATAYAFFYCDGVAEILVRLWSIPSSAVRRARKANGLEDIEDAQTISTKVAERFPLALRGLAFSSVRSLEKHLGSAPQVSITTSYINWNGPWIARWAGRDTDLFYSFAKHYYDLLAQHLPDDVSQEQSFCAPGFALVQAQLLTLLDAVIHRVNTQPSIQTFKGSSFNDVLTDADASAAVLPISPGSVNRSMAESRLVMLLRDCLSGNGAISSRAQELFAISYECLIKAVACQTSRFDHFACFTLCDFLEEALVIFVRFCESSEATSTSLDWPFWIEVLQLMMASNNSMTEIRLCALLYSLWGTITGDEARRKAVCLDWLLGEHIFQRQFNHWCPMVRAYYMRLLVWRVGRLDGAASELNATILETLHLRLNTVWCHYLYLQDYAQQQDRFFPSTAPCSPAPGRCLLIMRNDQATPPGMFLSFDSILGPPHKEGVELQKQPVSKDLPPSTHRAAQGLEKPANGGKRRWGVLKNILPFTSSSSTSPNTNSPVVATNSGTGPSQEVAPARQPVQPQQIIPPHYYSPRPKLAYLCHSFRFSLEWFENGNMPSKDRKLYPPKLPRTANAFLQSLPKLESENKPLEPRGASAGPSKYAGRALAEWAILIGECQNFFERRRYEGVPDDSKVETPTLSVEPFRRPEKLP